ncbi:HAD hydrolase family protein [Aliiglaciecola lipolytica]|uniref:Low specificity phosphatase (HAD superfamily)-like n=1 Tax=Aliiglaciecola lipolytica E3 TaxID=1127673 RepID=K6YVC2_9ALTE|nr:HAD hydrolase family protein [Aliiglaciecola lipolytica]GAC15210.1 low specificity phosphatase (HAD superfamily)-like [Aliiglaciecola lipolytica E3]
MGLTPLLDAPSVFILDVDGVMTDGKFYYSVDGKVMKVFGADDSDALSLLTEFIEIQFVTGDKRGFDISKARIQDDMKYPLSLVSTTKRAQWIAERWDSSKVIYMGDGIFDHYVFSQVAYSIAPANADSNCLKKADFITQRTGAERAVAEACLHILAKFFTAYEPNLPPKNSAGEMSGG